MEEREKGKIRRQQRNSDQYMQIYFPLNDMIDSDLAKLNWLNNKNSDSGTSVLE